MSEQVKTENKPQVPKPKYEKPELVPLGELAKGAGTCAIGVTPAVCTVGGIDVTVCLFGSGAAG